MSLNDIIKITITSDNLQMSQTGFGVPLVISETPWDERVKIITQMSDLPKTVETTDALYGVVKAMLSQNPKVPKVKIGKRVSGETLVDAFNQISLTDGDFYGIIVSGATPEDIQGLADLLETSRLLLGVDYQDNLETVAGKCQSKKLTRVFFVKANDKSYAAAALMSKMLAQAPGAASWAFKELTDVVPASLTPDESAKLKALNINRYINIKNTGVTLDGCVASGEFIDIIHGVDWLHVRMQERLFRLLMVNPKIPYTLKGVDLVRLEIMTQLKEGIYRGLLAADPEPQVSIPDIEDIDTVTRQQRKLPDVRFNARLAGAIHMIEIQGKVTA